ncbi:MAG: xanthine dehydrogenase family protein molybdopterin-binding subunit [Rhodocyclaceae bacterium]|jgi:xanthine dehydrogenase molybdenum-binding subunit|nr:xanthine dehydrogenase family protein molybdopterin-binding subunit [Rhodocyclaceae bacterium]MBK6675995.1 xanthine dehydrogenase family protein molybdopterin-binding subunit [Rhodocyclaceae bacterium]MBK9311382.1 xanthine dehydrogenase family protein molybdopterin-binding subunit [Rhodocyclaceae bacterium]MBK9956463.1 xanthine dehydrogenase family protein molybdopterin-binding subunit [Rhodocyclaceae bacterium]
MSEVLQSTAPSTLIGQRIPKLDAPDKAAGRTRYVHDIQLPGQLYGAILRSERVHARILRIDTSKARALPGVSAVITAADIPDQRPIGVVKDNLPLKTDRVRSLRDEIAAVAAESEELARHALTLIEVEYEDLSAVTDAADSLLPGAMLIHPPIAGAKSGDPVGLAGRDDNIAMRFDYVHGDVGQGEAESDVIVEDTFYLHYVTHCCMGVSGVIAEFDAKGNLLLYSNTQVPFLHKREFAEYLHIDPSRVRIIQPPIGGGFGSKLDIYPFEVICVYLARATGRPVRMVYTREEEFMASPTRQPVRLTLRSGCKKDGTLTFRSVHTLHDNGAYTSWGATTPVVMMQAFASLYRLPHCEYHTVAVYSNNPYAGSFRGYGNLQATFAIESHMEKMAAAIGMDPLAFRLKNAHVKGEETGQGNIFRSCGFQDCLKIAAERSDFLHKWREYTGKQKEPGRFKRGVGLAAMLHVGGGAKIYQSDGCGTIIKIDDFGHVTLITGASEIGQGSETVLAQLVCEELGLPISAVSVVNNDTEITPWDVGVHASRTTFVAGNSAIGAARKAKDKILEAAAPRFACAPEDLDMKGGGIVRKATGEMLTNLPRFIRSLHFAQQSDLVITTNYYEPPSVHFDKGYKGDISAAYSWAAQVVEVEVDLDTGAVRLVKVTGAHDVGRVLNRLGLEGQIEGGVVMGQGYALTEDLQVEGGKIRNPNFRDYKLVTAPEVPQMDISFVESMDGEGPQGAKGVGEAPAISMAAAIANAIENATGVRITSLPFTPERVYRALHGALPELPTTPKVAA